MGRVTVFTADGCCHCRRTVGALQSRKIPFVQISITQYPEKQSDMIALSNRIATPQVFFNTRHVGGAKECIALLEKWDQEISKSSRGGGKRGYSNAYERYVVEVERFHDPCNPRFDAPTGEPLKTDSGPPRGEQQYSIRLPWSNKTKMTVLQMMEQLKSILPKNQDMTKRMVRHKRIFTLAQAVEALQRHYSSDNISDEDSLELIQHLIQEKLIVVVLASGATCTGDLTTTTALKDSLQNSPNTLLRLQCYAEPLVLNSYRVWQEDLQGVKPCQLLRELSNMMSQIHEAITDEHGKVDYPAGKEHELYPAFEEASCALQKVDLGDLKHDDEKIAFGINLYNLMIKYAFIKVGAGDTDYNRLVFFNRVTFQVGPHRYSFQDWENGILRGNRRAPYAMSLQFATKAKKRDPRLDFVVQKVDPRIHFALNCGAESCPPVSYYTSKNLHRELHLAAAAFCEDNGNLCIDEEKYELRISKIFSWYKQDFVEHSKQYPERMMKYMMSLKKQTLEKVCESAQRELQKVKLSYLPYDWSTQAKSIATFNMNEHKLQERSGPLQVFSQPQKPLLTKSPYALNEEGKMTEHSSSSWSRDNFLTLEQEKSSPPAREDTPATRNEDVS